jgi:hypothetical protein
MIFPSKDEEWRSIASLKKAAFEKIEIPRDAALAYLLMTFVTSLVQNSTNLLFRRQVLDILYSNMDDLHL